MKPDHLLDGTRLLVVTSALVSLLAGCGSECAEKPCGVACGGNFGEQQWWCDRNHDCVHAGGSDSGPPPSLCSSVTAAVPAR
jgi:hypothetical protein